MFCFFFQAEDGIRDLVRSRGLGDVYKRQRLLSPQATDCAWPGVLTCAMIVGLMLLKTLKIETPVSISATATRSLTAQMSTAGPGVWVVAMIPVCAIKPPKGSVPCCPSVSYTHLTLPTSDLV